MGQKIAILETTDANRYYRSVEFYVLYTDGTWTEKNHHVVGSRESLADDDKVVATARIVVTENARRNTRLDGGVELIGPVSCLGGIAERTFLLEPRSGCYTLI